MAGVEGTRSLHAAGGSQAPGWSPASGAANACRVVLSTPATPDRPADPAKASELRRATPSEEAKELAALGETPTADGSVLRHLLEKSEDLPRPEVEAPIEAARPRRRSRCATGAGSRARSSARPRRPRARSAGASRARAPRGRAPCPGTAPRARPAACPGRSRRAKRIVSSIVSRVSPGSPMMNVPWILIPRAFAFFVNSRAMSSRTPFFTWLRIAWLPGLVADQQEPQPVVAQHLERRARHVRLGVARPRDAEPAEPAGDRLGARQVVRERVVVEEVLLHLREVAARPRDLGDHVLDRPRAVAMAAHRLRPEAEGAAATGSRGPCRATRTGAGGSR